MKVLFQKIIYTPDKFLEKVEANTGSDRNTTPHHCHFSTVGSFFGIDEGLRTRSDHLCGSVRYDEKLWGH